ncbi:hypothetical protein Asppvi_001865 [Aspergillus pseudoviridinutans]|uniref:Phosphatidylinositol-specific phospholipase C X domain-containing protein n=1 Tax=Aspergillus pseudoviridinutans TaxID=1517512 RepID=A0A9P3F0J6_9EURO|nr:uncharacterized protein Asppvi_001865 [Aspergillus pseudoviridinutans]GIJ92587.1 hypothetical protein Asppvi_001865 [Aspergillus pseudoviridinutans]
MAPILDADPSNWLSQLREHLGVERQSQMYLSSLTLPATHNSHATTDNIVGWAWQKMEVANCQSSDIRAQLDMGVRSIDLRIGKDLVLRHGKVTLQGHLRDALHTMHEWLDQHPNETIMFQAKWDYWGDDRQPDQDKAPGQVNDMIRKEFSARGLVLDQQPKLSECIGKMVLFNDNGAGAFPLKGPEAPRTDLPGDMDVIDAHWVHIQRVLEWALGTSSPANQGDYYEIPCAQQSLDKLENLTLDNLWNDITNVKRPIDFANVINPRLCDWLLGNIHRRGEGRLGRVYVDFANPDLVKAILLWNFV